MNPAEPGRIQLLLEPFAVGITWRMGLVVLTGPHLAAARRLDADTARR